MDKRRKQCEGYFTKTAKSDFGDVFPFDTENYRCLPRASQAALEPFSDEVREFLRASLPVRLSWTREEKQASPDSFQDGYRPKTLSATGDRLARFIVAMVGALFILVPMYIMALHQNRDKNLITTTVAVVLFALLCSVTLRTSNDQTLGATAGYAAVLTVFVGLTSG
jgi:VIT1/CCC1 family predicted Fe2+/Mn2+ transporter